MNFADMELTDNIAVEGITEDYVWYHSKLLTDKMSNWAHDFQKLVGVMEARHKEHLKLIEGLVMERKMLKSEIATLKAKE
jgi:hypothetical protein